MKDKEKLINDEAKKADDVKKEKRCHDEDMCRVSGGNENLNVQHVHKTNFASLLIAYGGPYLLGGPSHFERNFEGKMNRPGRVLFSDHKEKQNLDPKDKSFSENNSDSSKK